MERYRVGGLEFDGVLLSEADSRDPKRGDRWAEVRIYRTADGRYVTEHAAFAVDGPLAATVRMVDASEVPASLLTPNRAELTLVAVNALKAAAAIDPDLYRHAVERI